MIVDHSLADAAGGEFEAALAVLPAAKAIAERGKFVSMLTERPGDLFFVRMELVAAGSTDDIARSTLHPTEFYLDWIATLRAGDFNGDIELPN